MSKKNSFTNRKSKPHYEYKKRDEAIYTSSRLGIHFELETTFLKQAIQFDALILILEPSHRKIIFK